MSSVAREPYRTQHWQLTKPVASGRGGIVVAQNREVAEAGAAVLKAGGNAADMQPSIVGRAHER
jgi:gamma-glutamyltranspeptidase